MGKPTEFRDRVPIRPECIASDGVVLTKIVRKLMDENLLHEDYQAISLGSSTIIIRKTATLPHTGGIFSSFKKFEFQIINIDKIRYLEISGTASDVIEYMIFAVSAIFIIWVISDFSVVVSLFFMLVFFPILYAKYQFVVVVRLVEDITVSEGFTRDLSS